MYCSVLLSFFFSSRRRHTRYWRDWSSDVCSSDLRGVTSHRATARAVGNVHLLSLSHHGAHHGFERAFLHHGHLNHALLTALGKAGGEGKNKNKEHCDEISAIDFHCLQ